jgi:hypothetical protein
MMTPFESVKEAPGSILAAPHLCHFNPNARKTGARREPLAADVGYFHPHQASPHVGHQISHPNTRTTRVWGTPFFC